MTQPSPSSVGEEEIERIFEPYPGAFDDILGPEALDASPVAEPCPFCGCTTPLVGTTLDEGCYVFCGRDECFGSYAYTETEEAAIRGWNTRSHPSAREMSPEDVERPGLTREELVQAMYDSWPHKAISKALAEALAEATGRPIGATLTLDEARSAGADFSALERYADAILSVIQGPSS